MNDGQIGVASRGNRRSERRQLGSSLGVVDPAYDLARESTVRRARYEHGAGCFAEDALGDAPDTWRGSDETGIRTHAQQVDPLLFNLLHESGRRVSCEDPAVELDPGCVRGSVGFRKRSFRDGADRGIVRATSVDDEDHPEQRIGDRRKAYRLIDGNLRVR